MIKVDELSDSWHIMVWPFDSAPDEFCKLSPHGGDEDWVCLVPKIFDHLCISWLEEGSAFGVCCVSEHIIPDVGTVYIGAHA